MTKAGFWLNATIASIGILAFVCAAGFFGYKWLAFDEADRSYHCGSGSRGGLCFEGETTNMLLAFLFAAMAVATIMLCVKPFRDYRRGGGRPG